MCSQLRFSVHIIQVSFLKKTPLLLHCIDIVLQLNARVKSNFATIMHMAALGGNSALIQYLVEQGLPVVCRDKAGMMIIVRQYIHIFFRSISSVTRTGYENGDVHTYS